MERLRQRGYLVGAMYTTRMPALIKPFFEGSDWNVPGKERAVHLTFDDGPTPEVTPWVLDVLALHGAKATFFCIGRNVAEHPSIYARIREEGHAVGNHTWDHANGWRTPPFAYMRSVIRCQALTGTGLFRPPYGRIDRNLIPSFRKRFRIVMWDVLSGDFDPDIDGEHCLRNVMKHSRPGSIIVFHDSLKAEPRLRHALPKALEHFKREGYAMRALDPKLFKA